MTPTTRPSLLLRLRDPQDHAAWLEFVALYEPVVFRLLRKSGVQDADCRELGQEFFLIVSRQIEHWDPDRDRGSFRSWLRRVVRNLLVNWLKQRPRDGVAVGGSVMVEALNSLSAGDDEQPSEVDFELRRVVFQRASEQVRGEVSSKAWQAFWETAVVGTSPAEAGRRLGMSAGAVRVAKCRVLARLRELVTELET